MIIGAGLGFYRAAAGRPEATAIASTRTRSDGTPGVGPGLVRAGHLVGAGLSVASRGLVAEGRVSSVLVVFGLPVTDSDAGVGEGPEQLDVEAFVAETAVEGLDVSVPPRLAGRDEGQAEAFSGPVGHRGARQLGAVVAAQHLWVAAALGKPVKLVDEPVPSDGAF